MSLKINIDNYEEIMFRLVEDDFDEPTRTGLLQQIESDTLLKFEWESWQKTKFAEPLENYSDESRKLEEKILLIAENQTDSRKSFFYWAAAATIIFLIASLFLLTSDFRPRPGQEFAASSSKHLNTVKPVLNPVQNKVASIASTVRKNHQKQKTEENSMPAVSDSNTNGPDKIHIVEITKAIDSILITPPDLAKAPEKKPRYTITIENTNIANDSQQTTYLSKNRKGKLGNILTNTKMRLMRKTNGEPERIILFGEENSYLCINLNN